MCMPIGRDFQRGFTLVLCQCSSVNIKKSQEIFLEANFCSPQDISIFFQFLINLEGFTCEAHIVNIRLIRTTISYIWHKVHDEQKNYHLKIQLMFQTSTIPMICCFEECSALHFVVPLPRSIAHNHLQILKCRWYSSFSHSKELLRHAFK